MIDIDTIISYLTILYIIESVYKVNDRCLSSTSRANKCYFLAWLRIKRIPVYWVLPLFLSNNPYTI